MKLLLRSTLLFLALATFSPAAFGQITIWKNDGSAGNSLYTNSANWDNGVPDAATGAIFVTGWHSDPQNPGFVLIGGSGNILVTNSSSNQAAGSLRIDGNFTGTVTTNTTGTVTMQFTGSGSRLTVTNGVLVNGDDTLSFTGNLVVQNGTISIGNGTTLNGGAVNSSIAGNGTLILQGSLDYSSANAMVLGSGAANAGTVAEGVSGVTSAVVNAGSSLVIGGGGAGTYTLNSTSSLNSGAAGGTTISIGQNSGSGGVATGALIINDSSSVNLGSGSDIQVGTSTAGTGGSGSISQNGAGTTVNLAGSATMEIGDTTDGSGSYSLANGHLNIGTSASDTASVDIGVATGSTGVLVQSNGVLTALAGTTVTIGDAGTGTYDLAGGTADFQNGLTLGAQGSGNGTVTQTAGTLTVENNVFSIGQTGTALYTMAAGTSTFSAGVAVGANGRIIQTGGTMTIAGGDLNVAAGGTASVGGLLRVGDTHITGGGRLDFAGGTLQITSTTAGAFTDPLDSRLTGNTTIDAATLGGVTSVTLSGALSGTGGLTLVGDANTAFQFGNTITYSGATSVVSGTLTASNLDIANMSAINLSPAGALNLNLATGSFAYSGALTGAGRLTVNYGTAGDALVLRDTNNFSGSVLLGGNNTPGQLQVYNGTFASITQGGGGPSSVVIGGTPLTGVATPPATTGTVTIVNAGYTGLTLVTGGFTLNANTLQGTVTNNGSLFALGSLDLTNNGLLALPKTSAVGSTYNVTGAFTSNAGSTIQLRVNGNTATPVADSIVSTGAATVNSGTAFKIIGAGNITTPVAIVQGSSLTITPGALPTVNTTLLYVPTLTIDVANNSIDLTAVQVPLGTFALTPNEAATARAIDQTVANPGRLTLGQSNALNDLLIPLNRLKTPQQLARALEQLSPESLQYARNIAFENTTFLVQKMNGVDADLRGGYGGLDSNAVSVVSPVFNNGLGHSMQSLLASDSAFHPSAPNGVNYYPGGGSVPSSASMSPSSSGSNSVPPEWNSSNQVISDSPNPYLVRQHPDSMEGPRVSEFISGDAILADLNQNSSGSNAPSSSASYTAASATAGVSFRMTSHLAMGVLFDYNHTDARTDDAGSKTKVDSYSPGLFATYFDHGFYANGLFSFGYNNYNNTRNISTLGESTSSNPDGQQYVGSLDVGYDFHPDKNWVVGPTLGLTYTHLDIDSFQETGAPGANLAIASQSADSLRSRLGGHVVFQTNTGDVLLQPNFTAMWQHEFLDNSDGITSSFSDFGSSPFTINTASPTRDSALIGLGITATLDNSLAFYLNYFTDVGFNDYYAQSVIGGFKTRF